MLCRSCGFTVSVDSAESLCPRCSFGSALGLSAPAVGYAHAAVEGYELIEELGRGSMSVVWLARDQALDRLVALKVIAAPDPVLRQRLLREGQAAARLRHPHVVAVHAMGDRESQAFLAMDFLEGGNLSEKLGGQPLPPKQAAALVGKLAGALAAAHAEGILHRDIKPSNILLGGDGEPQLADFGLAIPLQGTGDLTLTGQVAGTPAYLAPELIQREGKASTRSDLYGLGAVLYVCLIGRPPFAGASVAAIVAQALEQDPVAPRLLEPVVPADLETICLKCLEKSPARRYASARELELDLGRFLRGEPIAARRASRLERAVRGCRRRPAAAK